MFLPKWPYSGVQVVVFQTLLLNGMWFSISCYFQLCGLHMVFGFVWFTGCGYLECSCSGVSSAVCWLVITVVRCSNEGTTNDVAHRRHRNS